MSKTSPSKAPLSNSKQTANTNPSQSGLYPTLTSSDEDKKQGGRLWDHLGEASHDHTGKDKVSFRDSNFRRQ